MQAMHEIELKFQVPAERLESLAGWLEARGATRIAMRAAYLDTPDRRLGRAGFALRLRSEGGPWVQTLKGRGADPMQRLEHNAPLQVPPGQALPDLLLARHAGTAVGDALQARLAADGGAAPALAVQYRTDFERLACPLRQGASRIEAALDRGEIRAAGRSLPIAELELELLEGSVADLLDLARALLPAHGLWLDVRSKAERGDRLARGAAPALPALPQAGAGAAAWVDALLSLAATTMAGEGSAAHLERLIALLAEPPAGLAGTLSRRSKVLGERLAVTPLAELPACLGDVAVQSLCLDLLAALPRGG